MTNTDCSTRPSQSIVARLHAEWAQLSCQPAALAEARSWALPVEPRSSLDDLFAAYDTGNGQCTADDDPLMTALVRRARHSELAARIVLQRMLPGLAAGARRRATSDHERVDLLDELVAEAWGVIRSASRRSDEFHIVSKLVRSCEYWVFRKGRRRTMICEMVSPERLDVPMETAACAEPIDELAELVQKARAAGGLTDRDLAMIAAMLTAPTADAAAKMLRITPRTLRNHRTAIAHRLRAVAMADEAA
jgi:hypothetical protein